jgi:hypothetical protein
MICSLPSCLVVLGVPLEIRMKAGHVWEFTKKDSFLICTPSTARGIYIFSSKRLKFRSKINATEKLKKSISVWQTWSNFELDSIKSTPQISKKLSSDGLIHAICYESDKWTGKKRGYIHTLTSNVNLYIDSKTSPSFFRTMGGKLRVTKRGLEG